MTFFLSIVILLLVIVMTTVDDLSTALDSDSAKIDVLLTEMQSVLDFIKVLTANPTIPQAVVDELNQKATDIGTKLDSLKTLEDQGVPPAQAPTS